MVARNVALHFFGDYMTLEWRLVHVLSAIASLLVLSSAFAASDQIRNAPQTKPATLSFGGMNYLHR